MAQFLKPLPFRLLRAGQYFEVILSEDEFREEAEIPGTKRFEHWYRKIEDEEVTIGQLTMQLNAVRDDGEKFWFDLNEIVQQIEEKIF